VVLALSMAGQAVSRDASAFVARQAIIHPHHEPVVGGRGDQRALIMVAFQAVDPARGDVSAVRKEDVDAGSGDALPRDISITFVESEKQVLLRVGTLLFIDVVAVETDTLPRQAGEHTGIGIPVTFDAFQLSVIKMHYMVKNDWLYGSVAAQHIATSDDGETGDDDQGSCYTYKTTHFKHTPYEPALL